MGVPPDLDNEKKLPVRFVAERQKKMKAEKQKEEARKKAEAEGLLEVDTGAPSISVAGLEDAEFLEKFGSGELPYSKDNVERVKKLIG